MAMLFALETPDTVTGLGLPVLVPSPRKMSLLLCLLPQHCTDPSVSKIHVNVVPNAMLVTVGIPDMVTGVLLVCEESHAAKKSRPGRSPQQ